MGTGLSSKASGRSPSPTFLVVGERTYDALCVASTIEAVGGEVEGPVDYESVTDRLRWASPDAVIVSYAREYFAALLLIDALRARAIPFLAISAFDPSPVSGDAVSLRFPASIEDLKDALRKALPASVLSRLDLDRPPLSLLPDHVFGE